MSGTTHNRLGPPTSVINQENVPPTGQSDGAFSQLSFPFQDDHSLCQVDEETKQSKTYP